MTKSAAGVSQLTYFRPSVIVGSPSHGIPVNDEGHRAEIHPDRVLGHIWERG